jgi:competence protein ComEC
MKRWTLPFAATRLLLLAAAAVSGLFGATAAQADQIVIQRNVTVREQPVAGSERVDFPPVGTALELLDNGVRRSGYYHVRLPDGREGWVYQSFVRRVADPAPTPSAPLSLHFIDVGQGDSTLILCPNGSTILIDAGSLSGRSPQEVRDYVVGQIAPLGGDIDYLIVSHPDGDHYNLLPAILNGVDVGLGYYVGDRGDYADTDVFDWLVTKPARTLKLSPQDFDGEAAPNSSIDCGPAKVWILAAAVQSSQSPKNSMSIVVMVRMGDFEAVITGDATHATENVIMARYSRPWLDIDVLRVGHHGSLATSTSATWANTLTPARAIFSAGFRNSFGHPRTEVVARLTPHTETVAAHPFRDATGTQGSYRFTDYPGFLEGAYSTATSGTIVIRTTGTGYRLETTR